jgi:hypothetical protein
MTNELLVMTLRVAEALLIGALIGLERSFHGRPAGFPHPGVASINPAHARARVPKRMDDPAGH